MMAVVFRVAVIRGAPFTRTGRTRCGPLVHRRPEQRDVGRADSGHRHRRRGGRRGVRGVVKVTVLLGCDQFPDGSTAQIRRVKGRFASRPAVYTALEAGPSTDWLLTLAQQIL